METDRIVRHVFKLATIAERRRSHVVAILLLALGDVESVAMHKLRGAVRVLRAARRLAAARAHVRELSAE